jgi:ATP-dependent 26S proteasome regulatory subunit
MDMGHPTPADGMPVGAASRPYLRALDAVLAAAVAHARGNDPSAAQDRWRGLHLDPETAEILARGGGLLSGFHADLAPLISAARQDAAMAVLARLYGLSDFALGALALAVAPETDARYGRIFGFLQDDVTRRLPTPALALDLFGGAGAARDRRRLDFTPGAQLVAQHLIAIEPAVNETALTAPLRLDPQIRQLLLGEPGVDPRLIGTCTLRAGLARMDKLTVAPALATALRQAAALQASVETPLRLLMLGPPGCGQDEAAEALAAEAGLPVLTLDLRALVAERGEARTLLALFRREALLANALVRMSHVDTLESEAHAAVRGILEDELPRLAPAVALDAAPGTWLAAAANRAGFAPLAFAPLSAALRRRLWDEEAATHDIALAPPELDTLAARFRMSSRQIAQASRGAAMALRLNSDPGPPGTALRACVASAQAQGGHELMRLAKRIIPRFAWSDIVTTEAVAAQLRELCDRVRLGATVLEGWRFADKLALGRGISALFAGPSGTGKTMAAEVIAGAVGLDLFKIDLASVVSKYIGETEKNLDRIFGAAEDCNGILLFDEADALFGKRSEVQDSHDRYANLEISYLLQKMEEFEGVAILSTNLQKNLDDAFIRRLSFIVHFPFPNADDRKRIWEVVWPDAAPRDPGLRFDRIADAYKLSGANIKSAALGAAYFAAAEGRPVGVAHVVRAIGREYEKLGRRLKAEEIASMLSPEARP